MCIDLDHVHAHAVELSIISGASAITTYTLKQEWIVTLDYPKSKITFLHDLKSNPGRLDLESSMPPINHTAGQKHCVCNIRKLDECTLCMLFKVKVF